MTPFEISSHSYRARKCGLGLSRLPLLLCLAASFSSVVSELVNITVDDQLGDPTTGLIPVYLPNDGTWHVGSPAENCSTCKIKPSTFDLSQIHAQTWHDATHSPSLTPATVTVHFNGSAVYVYNILANTLANTTTFVNITFAIDGADAGTFARSPDSSATILYNQLVYRNVALEDGPHTLVMSAGGGSKSLFLFDYLLYTTTQTAQSNSSAVAHGGAVSTTDSDPSSSSTSTPSSLAESSSPSSSSTPVGAIVGGVVGGVVILLGIVAVALLLRRRTLRARPTRIEAGTRPRTRNRRHGEGSEDDGFLTGTGRSPSSLFPASSEPSMSMRSFGDAPTPFATVASVETGTRTFPSSYIYTLDPTESEASSTARTQHTLHPHPHPHPPLPASAGNPSSAASYSYTYGPAISESLAPSTSVDVDPDRWSSKRRAELTRRLESLQRTRSILSSSEPPGPPGPSGSSALGSESFRFSMSVGSGTQRAMEELEAEIAELRGALAALSARVADSQMRGTDERVRGPRESLPAYVE